MVWASTLQRPWSRTISDCSVCRNGCRCWAAASPWKAHRAQAPSSKPRCPSMIKVLIADDHGIVRTGLRALITSDPSMQLAGEASGGYEAIDLVEKYLPDVLVLDLSMPDLDGISVTRARQPRFPGLHILILTIHEDEA